MLNHINPPLPSDKLPKKDPPLLHIFAQFAHHDEAFIIGNLEGLKKLHEVLTSIIHGVRDDQLDEHFNVDSVYDVFTNDGEGYEIVVILEDSPWSGKYWRRLAEPYTWEAISAKGPDYLYPVDLYFIKTSIPDGLETDTKERLKRLIS